MQVSQVRANAQLSPVHAFLPPGHPPLDGFKVKDARSIQALSRLGIGWLDNRILVEQARHGYRRSNTAMDVNLQPLVTAGSVTTPVQFLQNWLPGFTKVITAARNIDEFIGIAMVGAWEDEEAVQGLLELTGISVPYGDFTNVPFSGWNVNFIYRTNVRFEEGLRVGPLAQARAARIRVDTGGMTRESCALALEIQRNYIGFNGFNNGANLTYGFLNDPGLGAYQSVGGTGSGGSTFWSAKTFLEIQADILTAVQSLRTQSLDQIDPKKMPTTLAVSTNAVDYLSTTSDFGIAVINWIAQTYPKMRIVSAPELDLVNGGQNVFYLYADAIDDLSTDDRRTFMQIVPAKFMVLGVAQLAKGYEEDYSNATAGVMCKRPWAVTRWTGI